MSVLPKIKDPAPIRRYLGHVCPKCGWWRYGATLGFAESERLHPKCPGDLTIMAGVTTGRLFSQKLDGLVQRTHG